MRYILCHFNPNHDPRTGRFIEKTGGIFIESGESKSYKPRHEGNSLYVKRHQDRVIGAGKTLTTLSWDPSRTVNTDMFYAAYTKLDKHQYNALFNKAMEQPIVVDGVPIGSEKCLKYRIDNKARSDIKVASEDSAANVFANLYKNDRDFYNFLTDDSRMESHFVADKYRFKGYREARDVLHKMDQDGYVPTEKEVKTLYRMFNYVIPSQGTNQKEADDVKRQRAKFFSALKEQGYGAVLDTNDAIYGGFKAEMPVIVFDMNQVILDKVGRTKMSDKAVSNIAFSMRKILGI